MVSFDNLDKKVRANVSEHLGVKALGSKSRGRVEIRFDFYIPIEEQERHWIGWARVSVDTHKKHFRWNHFWPQQCLYIDKRIRIGTIAHNWVIELADRLVGLDGYEVSHRPVSGLRLDHMKGMGYETKEPNLIVPIEFSAYRDIGRSYAESQGLTFPEHAVLGAEML